MPISYTQSYLNQLPWATWMVCELFCIFSWQGTAWGFYYTAPTTLYTFLIREPRLKEKKTVTRKKISEQQAELQESDRSSGAGCYGGCPLCTCLSIAAMSPWLPCNLVMRRGHLFAHPTTLLDSITPQCSRLFNGVQKSESNLLRWRRTPNLQMPPPEWVLSPLHQQAKWGQKYFKNPQIYDLSLREVSVSESQGR